MGKVKSAIALVFVSLLIAVLGFFCLASFNYGEDKMNRFDSVLNMTDKDFNLGGSYGAGGVGYHGGGYAVVYYPEGVISAKQYRDDYEDDYEDKYLPYANGTLYLDRKVACEKDSDTITEEFKANFKTVADTLAKRVERLDQEGARVDVKDDFTVRVVLPASMDSGSYSFVLQALSFTGDLTVAYGSSEDTATTILPRRANEPISDFVKGARASSTAGNAYVVVRFTDKGREQLKIATAADDAGTTSGTLYFKIGGETLISLSVSEEIDQNRLYISSSSYTSEMAAAVSAVLDTSLEGTVSDFSMELREFYRYTAGYGDLALTLVYAAFGVAVLGMLIFFAFRYRILCLVHLYSFLVFLFPMMLCIWAIPFTYIGVETVIAVLLGAVMLSVANAVAFEAARKEYEQGKTFASSVKAGYKRVFWTIFDIHIAIALLAFMVFFVAITNLSTFAFVLGLATVFSGLCSLGVNRFCWAFMAGLSKRPAALAGFKRSKEALEDEE